MTATRRRSCQIFKTGTPGSATSYARLRRSGGRGGGRRSAEELRHSDFVPLAFELPFGGRDGALPAVEISDPDGDAAGRRQGGPRGRLAPGREALSAGGGLQVRKEEPLTSGQRPDGTGYSDAPVPLRAEKGGTAALWQGKLCPPACCICRRGTKFSTADPEHHAGAACRASGRRCCAAPGCCWTTRQVLQAMEHEALSEPAAICRCGCPGTAAAPVAWPPRAQLGQLGQYVDRLLHQHCPGGTRAATSTPIPAAAVKRTAPVPVSATGRRPAISRMAGIGIACATFCR